MSEDGANCVCKPGSYPVGLDCALCPKGHMCPAGLKIQCPMHYYQDAEGATSCSRCSSTGDANGFFTSCNRRGYQLQFCDQAVAGTQDTDPMLNCVSCGRCRRPYADEVYTQDASLVSCYRDR
jgi:hypothetical protein